MSTFSISRHLEVIGKNPLPSGIEPGIVTLVKSGLFHIHPDIVDGKPVYSKDLWKLPNGVIEALGIKHLLPPPYIEARLKQMEVVEGIIGVLQDLIPFGQSIADIKVEAPQDEA